LFSLARGIGAGCEDLSDKGPWSQIARAGVLRGGLLDLADGCILGLALQSPSQTTEIDANRSAVFRNGNGFTGIEPMTFDLFPTTSPHPNDLVSSCCFFITKTELFLFFAPIKKESSLFFFGASQQWTREGVRLASHLL